MFLFIIWGILIIFVSSFPHLETPSLGIRREDLLAHFFMYFVFGYLLMRIIKMNFKNILLGVIFGIFFGIINEISQLWIPGRSFEFSDILANTSGVIWSVLLKIFFTWI
jgi:VanZ family protein